MAWLASSDWKMGFTISYTYLIRTRLLNNLIKIVSGCKTCCSSSRRRKEIQHPPSLKTRFRLQSSSLKTRVRHQKSSSVKTRNRHQKSSSVWKKTSTSLQRPQVFVQTLKKDWTIENTRCRYPDGNREFIAKPFMLTL